MPGTIVAGNHDVAENGAARWRFSGQDLTRGDRVLRVVSVLER